MFFSVDRKRSPDCPRKGELRRLSPSHACFNPFWWSTKRCSYGRALLAGPQALGLALDADSIVGRARNERMRVQAFVDRRLAGVFAFRCRPDGARDNGRGHKHGGERYRATSGFHEKAPLMRSSVQAGSTAEPGSMPVAIPMAHGLFRKPWPLFGIML